MIIFFLLILTTYILFIILNKEKAIIEDIGVLKLISLAIGLEIYYTSIPFSTYTTIIGSSLYLFIKHLGLSLFFTILYTMVILNYELGKSSSLTNLNIQNNINNMKETTYNHEYCDNDNIVYNSNSNNNYSNISNDNTSKPINIRNGLIEMKKKKHENNTDNYNFTEVNEFILKKIKKVKSLYIEAVFFFIFYIFIILFVISTNYDDNNDPIQDNDKKWYYKSPLERYELLLNILELFLLFIIRIKSSKLLYYNEVFKYTIFISYSTIVGLFLGPLLNVT